MTKLVSSEKVSLKNHPEIKEDTIQKFIYENPSVLGLGELSSIQREKIQPQGGRLDLLLQDEENSRYEVEIQLGATDPSHIIRTIEYWDLERKRYPQYDHTAVFVAEEITGRFMNVISLFNGSIPLIALQMSAFKQGDDLSLTFTKVLDRITYATDEDEHIEVTDRKYWEGRSSKIILEEIDRIFKSMKESIPAMSDFEFKYNKFYIGMAKNDLVRNFVSFKPKKNWFYIVYKGTEDNEFLEKAKDLGFEIQYHARWNEYFLKISNFKDYESNKDFIDEQIKKSMEYLNL